MSILSFNDLKGIGKWQTVKVRTINLEDERKEIEARKKKDEEERNNKVGSKYQIISEFIYFTLY